MNPSTRRSRAQLCNRWAQTIMLPPWPLKRWPNSKQSWRKSRLLPRQVFNRPALRPWLDLRPLLRQRLPARLNWPPLSQSLLSQSLFGQSPRLRHVQRRLPLPPSWPPARHRLERSLGHQLQRRPLPQHQPQHQHQHQHLPLPPRRSRQATLLVGRTPRVRVIHSQPACRYQSAVSRTPSANRTRGCQSSSWRANEPSHTQPPISCSSLHLSRVSMTA